MREWLRRWRAGLGDWWYFRVLALVPVRRTRFRELYAELEREREWQRERVGELIALAERARPGDPAGVLEEGLRALREHEDGRT